MQLLQVKALCLTKASLSISARLTSLAKRRSQSFLSARFLQSKPPTSDHKPLPYKGLKIGLFCIFIVFTFSIFFCTTGIPKETWPNEKRIAMVPASVTVLSKKGIQILVEEDAGAGARFSNADFETSGAKVVDRQDIFSKSDVIFKVRAPILETEVNLLKDRSTLISLLFPAQNKELLEALARKQMDVFAVDCIPRISRAQTYDVLSSMANIAGYALSTFLCFLTNLLLILKLQGGY